MKNKGIHIIYLVMLIVVLLLIIYAGGKTQSGGGNELHKDYKLINNELSYEISDNGIIVLYELGKEYPKGCSIVVQTKYQSLKVYIDGKKIYEYYTRLPSKSWHDIAIKPEYYGKKIKFIYKDQYGTTQDVIYNNFYCGDFISVILHEIKNSFMGELCCLLLAVLGIINIALSLLQKRKNKDKKILYLGIFSLSVAMWSFVQSGFLQIIVKNDNILSLLEYELLFCSLLFMVKFKKEHYNELIKKIYKIMMIAVEACMIMCNILLFLGVDFKEIQLFTYVSIICLSSVAVVVYFYYKESGNKSKIMKNSKNLKTKKQVDMYMPEDDKYEQKEKYMRLNIFLIVLPCIMDIILFYSRKIYWMQIGGYAKYDEFLLFKMGSVVFVTIIGSDIIEHVKEMVVIGKKTIRLEELAKQDSLTKASSRTSYAEFVEKINKDKELCYNKMIVSFDVNDLKVINDNYGHDAGDRYLIDCVHVIKDAFKEMGECYRIGGDEFIVIIDDYNEEIFRKCKEKMQTELKLCKREYDNKPISIAYGYAEFDDKLDNNILDTVKRADVMMYRRKNKIKARR